MADPRLKKAIAKLCKIRVKSKGAITSLVRAHLALDIEKLKACTKDHRDTLIKERQLPAGARAKKANAAFETKLFVTSVSELKLKFRGFHQNNKVNKSKSMDFLKGQFNKRLQLKRSYPSNGDAYRSTSRPKKLKMSPP